MQLSLKTRAGRSRNGKKKKNSLGKAHAIAIFVLSRAHLGSSTSELSLLGWRREEAQKKGREKGRIVRVSFFLFLSLGDGGSEGAADVEALAERGDGDRAPPALLPFRRRLLAAPPTADASFAGFLF